MHSTYILPDADPWKQWQGSILITSNETHRPFRTHWPKLTELLYVCSFFLPQLYLSQNLPSELEQLLVLSPSQRPAGRISLPTPRQGGSMRGPALTKAARPQSCLYTPGTRKAPGIYFIFILQQDDSYFSGSENVPVLDKGYLENTSDLGKTIL